MGKVTAHILISGRVQGVFYRSWTKELAESLGITGWVKNTSDGKVEIVSQGDKSNLDEFIKSLYIGSELAKVEDLIVEKVEGSEVFEDFKVKV